MRVRVRALLAQGGGAGCGPEERAALSEVSERQSPGREKQTEPRVRGGVVAEGRGGAGLRRTADVKLAVPLVGAALAGRRHPPAARRHWSDAPDFPVCELNAGL